MKPNLTEFQIEMLEIYNYLKSSTAVMTSREKWWFSTLEEEANFNDLYNLYLSPKQMAVWRSLYVSIKGRNNPHPTNEQ